MDDNFPIIITITMFLIPIMFFCCIIYCCWSCHSNRNKVVVVQHMIFSPEASVDILGPNYVAQKPDFIINK